MRRIEIFVSSAADVQKERCLADRLIRSVGAEFSVPVSASYSNWLRRLRIQDQITALSEDVSDEGLLLCPCFWEYPDFKSEQDYREQIPNTGQFDLVICILWSRLGCKLVPTFVMPDGSQPASATDYEIAWVLDESKRTPGFPSLHVYRNRSTPAAPLEPRKEREAFFRDWDSTQKFFGTWEKNSGAKFLEVCHAYQGLEEFENLFQKHFRDFLKGQLDQEIVTRRPPRKVRYWESNPFRGLAFFDVEHAPVFQGRTRAIGEVLDALKQQATAKKPFVLVLGTRGSGKSSLVRAGVLPVLMQVGIAEEDGPWRRAVTEPGAGGTTRDPFDELAAAILEKSALPELQEAASPNGWRILGAELREHPESAALRFKETLDQLSLQEFDRLLDEQDRESPPARRREGAELVRQMRLGRVKPKMQLALVVDQLEELFTGGFPPELQRRYIAALGALVRCERVFVVATLRSEFYATYQQTAELVELTAFSGRIDLQPQTPPEIRKMIRLPAEAAGLRFERDPKTGRSLDEALVDAAVASSEPLSLLEHLLSQLYLKQLERNDHLLRWTDYCELGGLDGALANHAEAVFSTLNRDEQDALEFVMVQLVKLGRAEEDMLKRRTVAYRDLVLSSDANNRKSAGAKGLVDRFIKEGLLSASIDLKQEVNVSITRETLIRRWPRVWRLLAKDLRFLGMRDRLDASLKLWLIRGRRTDDLLRHGAGLAEAEILLRDFGSSLNENQIDYIQKSLAMQRWCQRKGENIRLALIGSLVVLATATGSQWWNAKIQLKKAEKKAQLAQKNADLVASRGSALEAELKKAREQAQPPQRNADLAAGERGALESQLKEAEQKAQLAQKNADLATSDRSALESQLKKAEQRAQPAETSADLTASQPNPEQIQPANARSNAEVAPSIVSVVRLVNSVRSNGSGVSQCSSYCRCSE